MTNADLYLLTALLFILWAACSLASYRVYRRFYAGKGWAFYSRPMLTILGMCWAGPVSLGLALCADALMDLPRATAPGKVRGCEPPQADKESNKEAALYALFVMAAQLLWILPLVFVFRLVFGGKK